MSANRAFHPLPPKSFVSVLCARLNLCWIAIVVACLALPGTGDLQARPKTTSARAPEQTVKIVTSREHDTTRFFVENKELSEVTMTFQMDLVNLKGDVAFPYTATFPPGKTEAFSLDPVDPAAKWEFSYTNFFKLGSNCARHDDSAIYDLPYTPGQKFKVTQGYNGKYSHTGSNQYATDWQMPEGTLVLAARAGVVVRAKDDSDKGGPSMDFDRYNNFLLIRHDDGTLAHYCHLQKDGILVKPGQRVEAGDAVAHSGNTGFSSGAHLHFCVFKTKDGYQRVSLPVRFRTVSDGAATLVSGKSYRAADAIPTEVAHQPSSATPSLGGTLQ